MCGKTSWVVCEFVISLVDHREGIRGCFWAVPKLIGNFNAPVGMMGGRVVSDPLDGSGSIYYCWIFLYVV